MISLMSAIDTINWVYLWILGFNVGRPKGDDFYCNWKTAARAEKQFSLITKKYLKSLT